MYAAGMDGWRVIGIDCAVDPVNVGVAVGEIEGDCVVVRAATQCAKTRGVAETACAYAEGAAHVLFALDAPLGWPEALGRTLADHRAGQPIVSVGHMLFRRRTDDIVAREVKHQPLDVGANLIARTAAAALSDLEAIRSRFGAPIPLAWEVPPAANIAAIEVYPAATLRQLGVAPSAYKKPKEAANRLRMIENLAAVADLSAIHDVAAQHADAFDAAVCVIAGFDFLLGRCRPPAGDERELARHEGWIWFRTKR